MSGLSKQLVKALLRVIQSETERFSGSKVLREFSDGYRIGRIKGAGLLFDQADKARIAEVLSVEGIDPATPPDAWDQLTRADATRLGPDEKFTAAPVKRQRVAVKALPERPLLLDGRELILPRACHLDADGPSIVGRLGHETVLLVENWECFDRIDLVDLDFTPAGPNPLVIWRGDPSSTRVDHALDIIRALDCPVWAFVDYDPAGLLIAARLPRLAGVIAPQSERLARDLEHGLRDRYEEQLHMAASALDDDPRESIQKLWHLIRGHGRALPQERYLREHHA
jgi:hypothetical protein